MVICAGGEVGGVVRSKVLTIERKVDMNSSFLVMEIWVFDGDCSSWWVLDDTSLSSSF